jgi:hypothetical protein
LLPLWSVQILYWLLETNRIDLDEVPSSIIGSQR